MERTPGGGEPIGECGPRIYHGSMFAGRFEEHCSRALASAGNRAIVVHTANDLPAVPMQRSVWAARTNCRRRGLHPPSAMPHH